MTEVTPLEAAREKLQRQTAAKAGGVVYACGTLDTKRRELEFMRARIRAAGVRVQLVDLSTSGSGVGGDIPPNAIALHHPRGPSSGFTGDRQTASEGMSIAFRNWVHARQDIAGLIGSGGAVGTRVLAAGFRDRFAPARHQDQHEEEPRMTSEIVGQTILWLIVAASTVFIAYWLISLLYRRSTKEMAFVQTWSASTEA